MKLSAEHIGVTIGQAQILQGVSLSLETHELVGLLGPNGSGKTTMLKCLYRTIKPSAGEIRIDVGLLPDFSAKETAKKIAVHAQHSPIAFDFTVYDMVLMGRSAYQRPLRDWSKEDHEQVQKALCAVEMEKEGTRMFSTLSGGERQRVLLARALAQNTPCLVLDEPTNHLDIKYQIQLLRLVKQLPCITIAALHDLNLAAMFCDRLYLMHKGRVMAHGSPEQVLTKQNIETVYEVPVTVTKRPDGRLNILYEA